jgi:membrane fusion protein (multidrug efflux system)
MTKVMRLKRLFVADRRFGFLLLAVGVGAVAIWGWNVWQEFRYSESTDNAYVRANMAPIGSTIPGYIAEVLINDNQLVEKDQVLVRIRSEEFSAQVRQGEAAAASLAAELKWSEQELSRAVALTAKGSATQQRVDQMTAGNKRASAELARARATLDQLRITLKDSEIRSPIRGTVGNRNAQIGQYVRPGTVLMEIVPLDQVWIIANFKETQIARMLPGQKAEIEVDSFPDIALTGLIDSLSPASGAEFSLLPPQNASGNFNKIVQRIPVKIVLPADHALQGRLRPGMSVEVSIRTDQAAPAISATPAIGDGQIATQQP